SSSSRSWGSREGRRPIRRGQPAGIQLARVNLEPRPRAGIAVCLLHPDPRRDIFRGKALQFIEERLARALWDAGLVPLALPEVGAGSEGVLLDQVDGLVLMGGADVSPASYGEEGIESNRWPGDRARDLYE